MKNKKASKKEDVVVTLEYKKPKLFWKIILGLLLFFILSTAISTFIVYRRVKAYRDQFLVGAQISREQLEQTMRTMAEDFADFSENPEKAIEQKTLLVLGADQVAGRSEGAILTDTVLLLQLDLKNNQIKTLALPRDLYHPDYQTKINALYYYGLERNQNNPLAFPTEAISELTQLDIDHTLLIEIESLKNLIDLLGGVEITIEEGFSDSLFPVEGVDVSVEKDPAVLYETVVFEEGKELMDGKRALQFMRSRNSGDDQGTDLARGQRQQLILQALMEKIVDSEFILKEPEKIGQLYRFYLDHFNKSLTINELARVAVSWLIINQNSQQPPLAPEFVSFKIPVYPEDDQGLIFNPPLWRTQQQWVYQIRDLAIFRKTIQDFFAENKLN
jgi:anionic cell wall polymer biosynthesis LytR-Cps2A-Psr (LCP) family protein